MQSRSTQADAQRHESHKTGKTIFIDMMSVRGHVTLNNFYLCSLDDGPVLYVAAEIGELFTDVQTRSLALRPCGSGLGSRVITALRVLRILLAERPRQAVFLSYDLATFALISRVAVLLRTNIICFEHNTAPRTGVKRLMHRLMARNVIRLVYAPHIQDLYIRAGIGTILVPHPCIAPLGRDATPYEWQSLLEQYQGHFLRTAFCPSASVALESIERIARQNPDTLFICKSDENSDVPNLLCQSYFKDYAGALSQCDLVCVPFAPDYKVSGPVFEAIAVGKPVMLLPNIFGRYMKTVFAGQVLFPGETFPELGSATFPQVHNKNIIKRLSDLITNPQPSALRFGANKMMEKR